MTTADWLTTRTTIQLPDGWPAAYEFLVEHVTEALSDDPAWQAWWAGSGVPECRLQLTLREDTPETAVTVGRTHVEVRHAAVPEPFESREPRDLMARAAADVTTMLAAARRELHLDRLPAMDLPEPPDDLPRGTQRVDDPVFLPEVPVGGGFLSGLVARFRGR